MGRQAAGSLAGELLPRFQEGQIRLLGAAIYIEDHDVDRAYEIALEQVSLLHGELR